MSSSVTGNPFELDWLVNEHSAAVLEWTIPGYHAWIPEFDPSDPITFSPDLLWYLLIAGFVGFVILGLVALFLLLLS